MTSNTWAEAWDRLFARTTPKPASAGSDQPTAPEAAKPEPKPEASPRRVRKPKN